MRIFLIRVNRRYAAFPANFRGRLSPQDSALFFRRTTSPFFPCSILVEAKSQFIAERCYDGLICSKLSRTAKRPPIYCRLVKAVRSDSIAGEKPIHIAEDG
ncbi:Hypothetical protein NTJ_06621 [Nesidiocoris tenuis]|uniref:Uncharacterized protein n=1 Tax=Nesidiocoris tenuis TaxID=355587 RepID=A0ABN7AR42_9HEMI|nr:Hypothetical protein NTJ_06621 [Nesidiocoris tenuis]